MVEFRVTCLNGYWQIQASRHIHTARYVDLDQALAYLFCRLATHSSAMVVVTDARGMTERRVLRREE